jgi:hypothetical protein
MAVDATPNREEFDRIKAEAAPAGGRVVRGECSRARN